MSSQRFDHGHLEHPVFPATKTLPPPPNHVRPVSHSPSPSFEPQPQNYPNTSSAQSLDSQYSNIISNASSTADDGLFLLQAHEELTECEKAQGASHLDGDNNGHLEGSLTEKQVYRWDGKEYTVEGRSRVTIDVLPDVALLEIFDFYLDLGDQDYLYPYYASYVEGKLTAWYALVRVCRKWRNIVSGSPIRLNLQLYCIPHRTQLKERMVAWPALPIVVTGNCDETRDNKMWADNIEAVFKHSDRICLVNLDEIRSWQLEIVLAAMQLPFLALTRLCLSSKDGETAPVVPDSFLGGSAPHLRFLVLESIPFPGLPKLLLSATQLVYLNLWDIPQSGYISPETMVACLSVLTRLKTLRITFNSPGRRSRPPPPPTRTLLPVLTCLGFKGVSEYLEDLVARIDAPLLRNLNVTFFHQLILDIPQLTQFISRTPNFKIPDEVDEDEVFLEFSNGIAQVAIRPSFGLSLGMSCRASDWQLSFLTQICNWSFLQGLIPKAENLYIQDVPIYSDSEPPWQDDVEGSHGEWLELLRPFTAVKELCISEKCVPRIAPALQELVGERETEALPALRTLFLKETALSSGPVREAIQQFVTRRQHSSHPIAVSQWK